MPSTSGEIKTRVPIAAWRARAPGLLRSPEALVRALRVGVGAGSGDRRSGLVRPGGSEIGAGRVVLP